MNSPPPCRGGFTLVELLTAMTIGAIVLLTSASLLGSAGMIFRRMSSQISIHQENRAAITQLAADLSSAVAHPVNRFAPSPSPAAWPQDFLGFLCLQPASAQTPEHRLADLCAVHYTLRDFSTSTGTTRCLVRGLLESAESFEALRSGKTDLLFQSKPQLADPIAFGVLSFQARPKIRSPQGRWIDPETSPITPPQAVQIRIVLASPALRSRLTRSEDWDQLKQDEHRQDLEIIETMLPFGPPP